MTLGVVGLIIMIRLMVSGAGSSGRGTVRLESLLSSAPLSVWERGGKASEAGRERLQGQEWCFGQLDRDQVFAKNGLVAINYSEADILHILPPEGLLFLQSSQSVNNALQYLAPSDV